MLQFGYQLPLVTGNYLFHLNIIFGKSQSDFCELEGAR